MNIYRVYTKKKLNAENLLLLFVFCCDSNFSKYCKFNSDRCFEHDTHGLLSISAVYTNQTNARCTSSSSSRTPDYRLTKSNDDSQRKKKKKQK